MQVECGCVDPPHQIKILCNKSKSKNSQCFPNFSIENDSHLAYILISFQFFGIIVRQESLSFQTKSIFLGFYDMIHPFSDKVFKKPKNCSNDLF